MAAVAGSARGAATPPFRPPPFVGPPLATRRHSPRAAPSPSPIPTAVSTADVADANPAAARTFVSRLLDSARRTLSGAHPWSELADRSALSRPDTISEHDVGDADGRVGVRRRTGAAAPRGKGAGGGR